MIDMIIILLGLTIPIMVLAIYWKINHSISKRRGKALVKPFNSNYEKELNRELSSLQKNISRQKIVDGGVLISRLKQIEENFSTLWLLVKDDEVNRQRVSVRYADSFKRLNNIIGDDYWGSITEHPERWEDAEKKKQEVIDMTTSLQEQILMNIKQENRNRSLEFNVDLKLLNPGSR